MKILHTSDWHLGHTLYGRKRYKEFEKFFQWLLETIQNENIEALLIAGDIFDTFSPSNTAQQLYYRFLKEVSQTICQNVIVIAGNHDSPSFLNAPKELLKILNVHVISYKTEDIEEELIEIKNKSGEIQALICAVPYLRDKDIRNAEAGESFEDKNRKLIKGIQNHYHLLTQIAENKRNHFLKNDIPIIAMGHLFTAGGKTIDGDGIRELYVGNLAHLNKESFPKGIDYLALGHLHIPQCVDKTPHFRYSGSPLPLSFGEAEQIKKVIIVSFSGKKPNVQEIPVPSFQELKRISGTLHEILLEIDKLKIQGCAALLEIECSDTEAPSIIREKIFSRIENSSLETLKIKNQTLLNRILNLNEVQQSLEDYDEKTVFKQLLQESDIPENEQEELNMTYLELIKNIHENDTHAE